MAAPVGFDLPLDTAPMEARTVAALPDGDGWQFEPKWDGFRCLAFRRGAAVELRAKSGKPLSRYFPEVVALLGRISQARFVLDGELVIDGGGFDALQQRLHPAESRIRRLAAETPARLVGFDLLSSDGKLLMGEALERRRPALEAFMAKAARPGLGLSPMSRDRRQAEAWLAAAGRGETDGVIAKPLALPYLAGERAMLKVKPVRTADCVVGGFRYQSGGDLVGSLLLGLYDDSGRLDHVGFTSTIADAERADLTRRLEQLRGGPGFTGKAPGGPSRWSTGRSAEWQPVRPDLVVEVRFDQVTAGRFRHGTKLLRWRPDKAPRQCTCAQLAPVSVG